ncbi:MAG TPA: hypothetical protein VFU10_02275 [Gaiellaceae bacterium]|nr:hypothetical protein [Gaiellaceae bacterium]
MVAALAVPPTEVVEERSGPGDGRGGASGEVESALGPDDHVAGQRGHVRGVGGDEVLPRGDCPFERLFEQRQRSCEVPGQAEDAAALEQNPHARNVARASECLRVLQVAARLVEPPLQALDARELGKHFCAARIACLLMQGGAQPPLGCV